MDLVRGGEAIWGGIKAFSLDDIERCILRGELISCMGRDHGSGFICWTDGILRGEGFTCRGIGRGRGCSILRGE